MADRVLIVEDEEVVRELLEGWLEEAGYETLGSADGLDGLRKLYSFRPDLVVADILMPNMDGFELCRLAREVCDAPIMILSGLGKEEDKVKGLNLGTDDYVVKPVPMESSSPECLRCSVAAIETETPRPTTTSIRTTC